MPHVATSVMIKGHTMAMPARVTHSHKILCSQATQVSIRTSNIGTQFSLRCFRTAGSQTPVFPESALNNARAGGSFEKVPASQSGVCSAEDALEEQQANPNSSCTSFSCNRSPPRTTVSNHGTIQVEGKLCAVQSHQPHKRQKCDLTVHEERNAAATPDTCTGCKEQFCQKSVVPNHMAFHAGRNPHVRSVSQEILATKRNSLTSETLYSGKNSYVCSVCQKSFSKKFNLVSHERLHTGEKPYVCGICQKRFAHKCHLVIHEKLHSGKKPYVCMVCQKGFTAKHSLLCHERSHTGERPFVCNVCQKSFTKRNNMVRHMGLHSDENPYICGVCQKCFATKRDLVYHKRSHTGEKLHVCSVCQKSFGKKYHLVRHEKLHTGQKSYVCSVSEKLCAKKPSSCS